MQHNKPDFSVSESRRKINPYPDFGSAVKPDGTPGDNDRIEIGPTALAFSEWEEQGLQVPDLARLRTSGRSLATGR